MADKETRKRVKMSRKKAYAKAYLTGRDHYKQFGDADKTSVRCSARRGYRKGLRDANFEAKQRSQLKY